MAAKPKPRHGEPAVVDSAVSVNEVHLSPVELHHAECLTTSAANLIKAGHHELAAPLLDEFDSQPRFVANTVSRGMRVGIMAVKPTTDDCVLAEEDVDILQALAESPHAMALIDLAAASGHDRKKCGERVQHLKASGLVAPPDGKANCVGVTGKGRQWLAAHTAQK